MSCSAALNVDDDGDDPAGGGVGQHRSAEVAKCNQHHETQSLWRIGTSVLLVRLLVLVLVVMAVVLRRRRCLVRGSLSLAAASLLLAVVSPAVGAGRAVVADAQAAAVLLVPVTEGLAAKGEVVVFDYGGHHPRLLLRLLHHVELLLLVEGLHVGEVVVWLPRVGRVVCL